MRRIACWRCCRRRSTWRSNGSGALDNPVKGVERNQEVKRQRYLSGDEMTALLAALNAHKDTQAANVIRLLLLTGARRGEVLNATWGQFDLAAGDLDQACREHQAKARASHAAVRAGSAITA